MTDSRRPVPAGGERHLNDPWIAGLIENGLARVGEICAEGCDYQRSVRVELSDELAGEWLIEEDCRRCGGAQIRRAPNEKEERRATWRVRGRRIATERSATYAEYQAHLRSEAWQQTRRLLIDHYGGCVLCGETERLHVHHRTYARVGVERFSDLTVLCAECHDHFHNAWGLED